MNPTDIQGDPLDASETIGLIGATSLDLHDPTRFGRVQDIIDYFKDRPDKKTMIYKITIGKPMVDKINHVWEYVTIRKDYEKTMQEHNSLDEKLKKLQTSRSYLEKQLSYFES